MNLQNESMPQPSPVDHLMGPAVMSHREIARVLGITRNAVYETDKRALRKLRQILTRRLGADYFGGQS